jgi:hypothetical protein
MLASTKIKEKICSKKFFWFPKKIRFRNRNKVYLFLTINKVIREIPIKEKIKMF